MIKRNSFYFFAFVLDLFASLHLQSQEVRWDSTHRPGSFQTKWDQFNSYPNSTSDIIFLGNSITYGTDWNELLGMTTCRNRGISGDITFGVLQRLDEVTEGQPEKVFILIGINDIQHNIPDTVIVNNYRRIIRKIKHDAPKTTICFQTLLPVNNEFTRFKNHYNKDEHILFVNNALKQLAAEEKITVIDLHPHFLNSRQKLDKRYTMDGLHLNAEGYKKWAAVLKKYLNR